MSVCRPGRQNCVPADVLGTSPTLAWGLGWYVLGFQPIGIRVGIACRAARAVLLLGPAPGLRCGIATRAPGGCPTSEHRPVSRPLFSAPDALQASFAHQSFAAEASSWSPRSRSSSRDRSIACAVLAGAVPAPAPPRAPPTRRGPTQEPGGDEGHRDGLRSDRERRIGDGTLDGDRLVGGGEEPAGPGVGRRQCDVPGQSRDDAGSGKAPAEADRISCAVLDDIVLTDSDVDGIAEEGQNDAGVAPGGG